MVRPRRITSIALSTLAVVGGLATALPAQAMAAVSVAQTQQLAPSGISVGGVINASGVFSGYMYLSAGDAVGANAKFTVDYGDGGKFTQNGGPVPTAQSPLNLNHQYAAGGYGTHTITVTVDDGSGAAPVSKTYNAVWHYGTAPTEPSVAVAKTGGDAPFTATASISGGTVDAAATKSYVINWGDGSPIQTIAAPASGPLTLSHLYAKPLMYEITTHTSDGVDVSYLNNDTPNTAVVTAYGVALSADTGAYNAFLTMAGYGAPLEYTHSYEMYINWGDGSKIEQFQPNGSENHFYTTPGTYTISVKMADGADPNNTSLPQYTATTTVVITGNPGQPRPGALSVNRLWGGDRYGTSVSVAGQWAAGSADAVVLARGDAAPDALAGGPFAAHVNGPLLLTNPNAMPTVVRAAIDRVTGGPKTKKPIYILGGIGAVSQQQEDGLRSAGYTVVRLGGATRFDTALKIAGQFGPTKHVIVATGLNFPDALAAGPLGAAENAPIVLTSDTATDPATAAFIRQHADVDPVGVQAQKAVAALNTAGQTVDHSLAGGDRYATATAVAARWAAIVGHAPTTVGLASGMVFADALSGGAYAGKLGAPLVLTNPQSLSSATEAYLAGLRQAKELQAVDIFGGTNAVSQSIEGQLKNM
ncbi:putative cell wall-binding protein [Catenulispora sp. EB89]|uniref:cell wall-binding repeat-containing protein n=1 Tax=Catenulispora sp. EB89 TaxID=3156257 RepID=UPI0035122775